MRLLVGLYLLAVVIGLLFAFGAFRLASRADQPPRNIGPRPADAEAERAVAFTEYRSHVAGDNA